MELEKPNFDSLPDDQKEKCRLFYKIEDDEFFNSDLNDNLDEEAEIAQVAAPEIDPNSSAARAHDQGSSSCR